MGIFRILADTGVKFVHGIVQTFGVLVEGAFKLSTRVGEDLVALDRKIITPSSKKTKNDEEKPT